MNALQTYMRSLACKACFEFGGESFEALLMGETVGRVGKGSTTACIACKAACDSAEHVLIVDQFGFLMEHFPARLQ